MTNELTTVSVKLPLRDLRRIATKRGELSAFIRLAVAEKLAREPASSWQPTTPKGKKLLSLRSKFIAQGGELLGANSIAPELKAGRGGIE